MSDSHTGGLSPLARKMTLTALILFLLYVQILGTRMIGPSIFAVILTFPWLLLITGHRNLCFVLAVGVFHSWIYIPGVPQSLTLHILLAAFCIGLMILSFLLKKPSYLPANITSGMVTGYLVIVVITMLVRGIGLRTTGSNIWGGKSYIELVVTSLFYLLSGVIILTPKHCKAMIALFFGLSILPSIAEFIFIISHGSFPWLYMIIMQDTFSAQSSLAMIQGGFGILRFQLMRNLSNLFILSVALFPFRNAGKLIITVAFIIGFLAVGISGHRSSVIHLMLFIPAYAWIKTGKLPIRLLSWYVIGLCCLFVFMLFFATLLPLSIQRAFAWMPYVEVDWLAKHSATDSIEWRLMVWERAVRYIPDHLIIGRGFTYDAALFNNLKYFKDTHIEWAVLSHAYHNGLLSMLIDLGVGGLFFGLALMYSGIVQNLKLLKANWNDLTLKRYFQVILASLTVHVIRFLVIHGDATNSVIKVLVNLTILAALWRADRQLDTPLKKEQDTISV